MLATNLAEITTWPQAVAVVAICAASAFIAWVVLRDK